MSLAHTPARSGGAWLRMAWPRLAEAIARRRLEMRQRRELELLDANALRDLGLHRSELASYLAECNGSAESTRRRLAGATCFFSSFKLSPFACRFRFLLHDGLNSRP